MKEERREEEQEGIEMEGELVPAWENYEHYLYQQHVNIDKLIIQMEGS